MISSKIIDYGYLWPTTSQPSFGSFILSIFIGYIVFEILFFFHYHRNLIPFANRICRSRPPAPYRDYRDVGERVKLMSRILDRLEEHYELTKNTSKEETSKSEVYYNFIQSWFCKKKEKDFKYERFSEQLDLTTLDVGLCPPLSLSSFSCVSVSDDDGWSSNDSLPQLVHNSKKRNNTYPGILCRENMDEFLTWAFFGVDLATVESDAEMKEALEHFYQVLDSKAGLQFEPGRNPHFTPRWFTFEDVQSLYRPYAIYAVIALLQFIAKCVLYVIGFRQYTCETGLSYWHRAATNQRHCERPFLFFHGIAPGGFVFYVPMVLRGLLRGKSRQRDIFFFENKPISYSLCFEALSEEATVNGVLEAVNQHLDLDRANNLTLCGHSFGSFQLTWMVNSPLLQSRIRTMILLDPVSILLHEPDVVVNFLYSRHQDQDNSYIEEPCTTLGKMVQSLHESKIRLVASSELFVEHYLRRNFAWYNSELWLDDIPSDVHVLVCLAKNDEITNVKKIEKELLRKKRNNMHKIVWEDVGHAHCISNPDRWNEIRNAMNALERQ